LGREQVIFICEPNERPMLDEEVDERQDKSLMQILVQRREEMTILEASRETIEFSVSQTNCFYECVFACSRENEVG
jgi:hypothetical protein